MKILICIFLICFQTESYSQIYFWGKDILKYDTNAIVTNCFLKENSIFSHFKAYKQDRSECNYYFESYKHKSSLSILKYPEKYTPTLITYTTKRLGEPFVTKTTCHYTNYFWKIVVEDLRCIIASLNYSDGLGIDFRVHIYKNEKIANEDLLYNTRGCEISVDSSIILKYKLKNF